MAENSRASTPVSTGPDHPGRKETDLLQTQTQAQTQRRTLSSTAVDTARLSAAIPAASSTNAWWACA